MVIEGWKRKFSVKLIKPDKYIRRLDIFITGIIKRKHTLHGEHDSEIIQDNYGHYEVPYYRGIVDYCVGERASAGRRLV